MRVIELLLQGKKVKDGDGYIKLDNDKIYRYRFDKYGKTEEVLHSTELLKEGEEYIEPKVLYIVTHEGYVGCLSRKKVPPIVQCSGYKWDCLTDDETICHCENCPFNHDGIEKEKCKITKVEY